MRSVNRTDLILALGIGATLGLGVTLLVRAGRSASRSQLGEELGPLKREVRRTLGAAREDALRIGRRTLARVRRI